MIDIDDYIKKERRDCLLVTSTPQARARPPCSRGRGRPPPSSPLSWWGTSGPSEGEMTRDCVESAISYLAGNVTIAGDVAEVRVFIVRVHLLGQRFESGNIQVFFRVHYNLDNVRWSRSFH